MHCPVQGRSRSQNGLLICRDGIGLDLCCPRCVTLVPLGSDGGVRVWGGSTLGMTLQLDKRLDCVYIDGRISDRCPLAR